MDLDQHLDRLGALLDRERAAEKDRFARLPLSERIRKGLGLEDTANTHVDPLEVGDINGGRLAQHA